MSVIDFHVVFCIANELIATYIDILTYDRQTCALTHIVGGNLGRTVIGPYIDGNVAGRTCSGHVP